MMKIIKFILLIFIIILSFQEIPSANSSSPLIDKISKNAVKLVDRLEFSRSNFNLAKDWVKG